LIETTQENHIITIIIICRAKRRKQTPSPNPKRNSSPRFVEAEEL
jgi:hypothetical protein